MSNAGYGNHDSEPKKVGAQAAPAAAATPPAPATDRPRVDLGGAQDKSSPQGAMAGAHAAPDPGPHAPANDSSSPSLSERRVDATPGVGPMPDGPQGGDVDPGAG